MCVGCNALVSDSPLMMEYLLLCDYPFLFDVFSPPYVWDVLLVVFVSITNHLCGFCFLNVILIYHWFSLFMFNFKYLVYFINTSVWCSCCYIVCGWVLMLLITVQRSRIIIFVGRTVPVSERHRTLYEFHFTCSRGLSTRMMRLWISGFLNTAKTQRSCVCSCMTLKIIKKKRICKYLCGVFCTVCSHWVAQM